MAEEPDTPDLDEVTTDIEDVKTEDAHTDEDAEADGEAQDDEDTPAGKTRRRLRIGSRFSQPARALVAGALVVAALAGLTGWLGYRAYQEREAQAQRDLFVQIARQGAVNLTTISYTEIDSDVQRILDLATGAFRDDFEHRSKPFMELVKAAQSVSEGTVTDAGLESQQGDSAQVLVAVAVKSRTAGGEEAPREWRMKIEVKAVGDDAKMSNVVFVP
ncbi:Mce protein [Mycobacterium gordonae]|uniref:Mce protein n=1 Tax=Mycobacterium gordonae TaxID=1778 RepID=A0A0Q2Q5F3_MYCGO|nr:MULTISPECIES: tetratricopeptide repeat protein [Mycobacterium]KQH75197.1 Mce protein [Mycobacterium gordonae]MDP7727300.1 tetratricopeptide repeat protein [Mycobacterium sp. TY813]